MYTFFYNLVNASNSGFILELIILFLCAFVSLINLYLLMEDSFKTGINSYNELVEFAFGNKAKIMMDIIIVIYCFGVIVGFQIAFAEFVWEVI